MYENIGGVTSWYSQSTHRVLLRVLSGQVGTQGVLSEQVGTHGVLSRQVGRYSRGTASAQLRHCAWYSRRARTCAHACAAEYVLGPANTNACPAGAAKITDDTTCRAAAAFLGKPYGSVFALSSKPSGCILRYLTFNAPMVYLNTDPTGGAASDAQLLCKGTGAPFQPPSHAHAP